MSGRALFFRALAAGCALLVAAPCSLSAAEPAAGSLNFRRIYAPAQGIQDWPRGNVRYVPIEPAEFERLVDAVRTIPSGANAATLVRITRARYQARLQNDTLEAGRATLDITHSGKAAALLPLFPCGLALESAHWSDDAAEMKLGVARDGKLAALVDRTEPMLLDWSLRGHRDSSGILHFQLDLPKCPENSVTLDLPAGMIPSTPHGQATADAETDGSRKRWRIELGGHHQAELRISPSDADSERRRLPLIKTSTSYEFSVRGIDVTAQWKIEVQHDPLRHITFTLDPGLRLISARHGETALAWTTTRDKESGRWRVVLELPEPLRGQGRTIRLTALAPLTADQPGRLPRIIPEGLAWQEGNLALLVPAPLVLKEIEPFLCRQSKTGPLPAPLAGESFELQCFGPEATAEVIVSRQVEPARLTSGTVIRLAGGERTGQMVADFQLPIGERFTMKADVSAEWIIDSVESVPPDVLSDWTLSSEAEGSSQLTVRLAKPLTQNHPLRLVLTARARSPAPGKPIAAKDLLLVAFRGATAGRQLLSLVAAAPYTIEMHDEDELALLAPDRLNNSDRALFLQQPQGLILQLDPRAGTWYVTLERQPPRYAADISIEATATSGPLIESYKIKCQPESSPIEKLLVYFTHARAEAPQWTLGNEIRGQLTASRLSAESQAAAGLAADGEAWEVRLSRPRSVPFELRAVRATSISGRLPLSLACLPEASTQQGTVVIVAPGELPLEIENHRLKAISPQPGGELDFDPTRGAYRYDPGHETSADASPAITIAIPQPLRWQVAAFVWRSELVSRYEASGSSLHWARLQIQNAGLPHCIVDLPEESTLLGAWIDDDLAGLESEKRRLAVALPADRKFCSVVLQFSMPGPALGIVRSWQPPKLRADIPVLIQHWQVWLPPTYEVLRSGRSVARRLLGPLSRSHLQPPFDPTVANDWYGFAGGGPLRVEAIAQAERLLTLIGTTTGQKPKNGAAATWSARLMQIQQERGPNAIPLLVDRQSLLECGINADSPLPESTSARDADPQDDSFSLLQRANLGLLIDSSAMLLTSADNVALHAAQVEPLGRGSLYWLTPGHLSRQLDSSVGQGSDHLVRVADWKPEQPSPWHASATKIIEPAASPGWNAYRFVGTGDQMPSISVVRGASLATACWVVFLVTLVLAYWKLRGRRPWLVRAAGVLAILAMLAPQLLAPLATAALLAVAVCLILVIALPLGGTVPTRLPPTPSSSPRLATVPQALSVGLMLMLLAAATAILSAAEPLESVTNSLDAVYRVFIPSDDQGKPTGARYLVPEEFYASLRRRSAEASGQPEGWLLQNASYSGVLSRSANETKLEVTEFTARFDLQVFESHSRVRIPLRREETNVAPGRAFLDGRPIDFQWDDEGESLSCDIPDAGLCRLELALEPVIRTTSGASGLEFHIPAVAMSHLELHLPANSPTIEIPTAVGVVRWADDRKSLSASLGPVDRLAISWPEDVEAQGEVSSADVEELLWLKVRPGSVLLDARFILKPVTGQIHELELLADPRLRLLPPTNQDSPIAQVEAVAALGSAAGDARTIRLKLKKPSSEELVVPVSFLVTGTSGVGNLRMPRLDVRQVRSTRRWLGLSIDSSLEFDSQSGAELQPVAVANFAVAWDAKGAEPSSAYELPRGEIAWGLATRPRQPRTTVKQDLSLSFYHGGASLQLDAQLTTSDGYTFQYRLHTPPKLEVESVSVLEDGVQRAARWADTGSGTVTVFLSGPVTGSQQLHLRGSLSTPVAGDFPLPWVEVDGAKTTSATVSIFRQPAVAVSLTSAVQLADTPEAAKVERYADSGRLVSSLIATGERPSATIVLSTNEPEARAEQVTSLRREGQAWQAELACRWTVEKGMLDVVRLEIPPQWTGPFTISPPATSSVLDVPGTSRRRLMIRPRSAIRGGYRFTVSGPLVFGSSEPIEAPNVVPLGVDKSERFVKLPRLVGLQHVAWETLQLRPAPVPETLLSNKLTSDVAEAAETFRVTGDRPMARLRSVERMSSLAQVRLADIRIAWQSDRSYQGVSTFDLEPADLADCTLRTPPSCRLVQIYVDGLIVTALPAGENQWRIPLALKQFPQRIEVIFAGQPKGEASWRGASIEAPMLDRLPVVKTLWTTYGPAGSSLGSVAGARPVSALRYELIRLQSLTALGDLPADGVSALPPEEVSLWYNRWFQRWRATRSDARQQLLNASHSSQTAHLENELSALEREQAVIAQRLGTMQAAGGRTTKPQLADQAADLWSFAMAEPHAPSRYLFQGSVSSLAIEDPQAAGSDLWTRLGAALLGLALICGLGRVPQVRVALRDGLRRWPHVWGVALGLAWWLWLAPSAVGLLIALFSVIASLQSAFRPARESGSTIVRLGVMDR
jgi:hypothetical protein